MGLDDRAWRTPMGEEERFELALAKVAGHDLAHLNQLARTVAAVSG